MYLYNNFVLSSFLSRAAAAELDTICSDARSGFSVPGQGQRGTAPLNQLCAAAAASSCLCVRASLHRLLGPFFFAIADAFFCETRNRHSAEFANNKAWNLEARAASGRTDFQEVFVQVFDG